MNILHAQRDLLDMMIGLVISRPGAVRRVASGEEFAADELDERFGTRTSDCSSPYEVVIDQLDPDIGWADLASPFVVSRPTDPRGGSR